MGQTASLRSRVHVSSLTGMLAVGDALALAVFFIVGEFRHGYHPLTNPGVVAGSLAPFLLTWALAALVGGLYRADAIASPLRAVAVTLPVWVLAALAGMGLRATSAFRGDTELSFIAVTLAVGGVLLIGWRVLASVTLGKEQ